jgi:hypothetical protein
MEYSLKNSLMEIKVESLGAELTGMKDLKTGKNISGRKILNFGQRALQYYFLLLEL